MRDMFSTANTTPISRDQVDVSVQSSQYRVSRMIAAGVERRAESAHVFQFAARQRVPIFVHVREAGMGGMQEVIANAAATGASLHIAIPGGRSRWGRSS